MDKLNMSSADLAKRNLEKLVSLFPDAITEVINNEGKLIHAIDKDILMQDINLEVIDGAKERYQFTWPDKKHSIVMANSPITKTLRLEKDKSLGRDGTNGEVNSKNIFIEGDNLDALKLLQETYLGKVKMIYIDPPYNTGNDFIYEDNFAQSVDEYADNSGQTDEDGNRLVQNSESNGRFHTDWLNMIYPRLKLARDFLTDDGVIFISIDDNEQENLKKVCDEIFGGNNFIAQIVWEKVHTRKNSAINFSSSHEYILCYAKIKRNNSRDIVGFRRNLLPRENTNAYSNPDNDPKGPWKADPITAHNPYAADYTITKPNGVVVHRPKDRYWAYSESSIRKMIKESAIIWGDGDSMPMAKRYLADVQNGLVPVTLFDREFAGDSSEAKKQLDRLFPELKGIFDYSKPVKLISRLIQIGTNEDDIVLDFFSGSATTANAVMQMNAEDGKNRKYILVQLPEKTNNQSEAHKAGYNTICDIGEERIRRAGKKIKEETDADIDYGFRCFKIDSSNMKDVYYAPADVEQLNLDGFEDNVKEDRTPEDLLIQVMLDLGILLSSDIETQDIAGKKVFSVADGYLLACFDKDVTEETVTKIAKKKPFYAVFRDNSMSNDSVAANFEQIFETYSPETVRKVL
ncbi:site-specific DNA-methyltransferase [Lactobacillus delbrueckii]